MDRNERRDRTRGQVLLLRQFYKDLRSWEVTSVGAWIAAGFLLFVDGVLFLIPWQKYAGCELETYVGIFAVLWMGIYMYMIPYMMITEDRKQKSLMEKLRNLPIDRRSILCFQLEKLFRMVLIFGAIQLVGQCAVAWLLYGRLEWANILFPVVVGMLLPGAVNAIVVVLSGMCVRMR